jgi:hypothetical protein
MMAALTIGIVLIYLLLFTASLSVLVICALEYFVKGRNLIKPRFLPIPVLIILLPVWVQIKASGNQTRFEYVYDNVATGDSLAKVRNLIEANGLKYLEEPTTKSLQATTWIGIGIDGNSLDLGVRFDDNGKVIDKEAFDTGVFF